MLGIICLDTFSNMYAYNLILLDCRKSNKLPLSRKNKSKFSLLMPIAVNSQDPNMLTKQLRQSSHAQSGAPFFPHV